MKTEYYNTTNLKGVELKKATSKALSQDEQVLAYFRSYDNLGATPERVLRHFRIMEKLSERRWHNTPITSIRRSFSNLKKRGLIVKTGYMIMGDYGKEVHVWKLVTNKN
jgi:hypothetical protein